MDFGDSAKVTMIKLSVTNRHSQRNYVSHYDTQHNRKHGTSYWQQRNENSITGGSWQEISQE